MKKLTTILLALSLSIAAVFSGCGNSAGTQEQEPAENAADSPEEAQEAPSSTGTTASDLTGSTLIWNIGVDSKTYDPTLNATTDGSCVINNTFEGLMRNWNDGAGLQPAAAAEAPEITDQPDGTQIYIFHLRESKWSDGKPVTAQDFVYSWKRLVDPSAAAELAFLLGPVVNANEIMSGEKDVSELGVEAVDDRTLKVTLKQPTPYFAELTSCSALMPVREDLVDNDGLWAKDPKKAVSNGPFVLSQYTMGQEAVFSKNPHYWNADNVKLDHIIGKMVVDASTTMSGFQGGEIHITDKVVSEELPQLVASGDCQLIPSLGNAFYVINFNTEIEALQNQKVRQALQISIDRKDIVENLARGGQKPIGGILPYGFIEPDGQDYREKTGNFHIQETADIEGAKKLLEEAGYPNGEGIPELEILYNTSEGNKTLAEAIQEMWGKIGINVKLNNQEWAVFQDTRNQGRYPAVAVHSVYSDYTDPQEIMEVFQTGNAWSGCGYSSAEYDAIMEQSLHSSGQERYDLFRKAEQVLIEDAYVIPLYSTVKAVLSQPEVKNWSMNSLSIFWFGDTEITTA